jgi:hypothetical protein
MRPSSANTIAVASARSGDRPSRARRSFFASISIFWSTGSRRERIAQSSSSSLGSGCSAIVPLSSRRAKFQRSRARVSRNWMASASFDGVRPPL